MHMYIYKDKSTQFICYLSKEGATVPRQNVFKSMLTL